MIYIIMFLSLLSFGLTKLLIYPLAQLLADGGALRKNFKGKEIPVAMGLVIGFGILPSLLIYGSLFNGKIVPQLLILFFITMSVGLIDDLLGNHEVKGLKGHFNLLLKKKKLSSGALKAIIISTISLYFSLLISNNYFVWILNFFILVLITNLFNLLDVRPGRAIKVYFLIGTVLVLTYTANNYLLIMLSSVLAFSPWDLKGKAMLGDTGSNLLGMSIGISVLLNLNLTLKIILFIALSYVHWYTERNSLTKLIERVYFLQFIDNLGR